MSYIRTKDGIYDELAVMGKYRDEPSTLIRLNKEIVKRATRVDALCDLFVCESNEEGNGFTAEYSDIWKMMRDDFWLKHKEHYDFYGAIRVKGKGLIYAAKLDKETGILVPMSVGGLSL